MRCGTLEKSGQIQNNLARSSQRLPLDKSVGEETTKIKKWKGSRQESNAAQASHPSRIVRVFLLQLDTAWRWNDRFRPDSARKGCRICQSQSPIRRLTMTNRQPLRRPAAFVLLRRAAWGRRPQRPGNQSRLHAFSGFLPGNSPSGIAGCRWLCRNHSASSGTFTFRWSHSPPDFRSWQCKSSVPLCRSCGGRDFPVDG